MQPPKLTDYQKEYCIKLMDKLKKRPISEPFWKLPTQEEERLYTINAVKEPINLQTIRDKLDRNEYKDFIEWGLDIRRVWSNAQNIHSKDDLMSKIAFELSSWFEKKIATFPRIPAEEWLQKLKIVHSKMKEINKDSPIIEDLILKLPPSGDAASSH